MHCAICKLYTFCSEDNLPKEKRGHFQCMILPSSISPVLQKENPEQSPPKFRVRVDAPLRWGSRDPLQTIPDNLPQWKSLREDSTNSADDKNSLIEDQNGRNDSALVQMVHRSDDVKPLKGFPTGCIIGTRLLAICKKNVGAGANFKKKNIKTTTKMPSLEAISKRKTL